MSMAVAAVCSGAPAVLAGAECVRKSYPGFLKICKQSAYRWRCWSHEKTKSGGTAGNRTDCRPGAHRRKLCQAAERRRVPGAGITQREEDLALARQRGWIAQGSTEEDPVLIGEAELVVFAVYPHVLVDWVSRNQQAFRPGAVLTTRDLVLG